MWLNHSDLDKDGEDESLRCQSHVVSVSGAGQVGLNDGAVLVVAMVTVQGRCCGYGMGGRQGGGTTGRRSL